MPDTPITFDDLDRRILLTLQRDASLTNLALSRRVHASAPTCLRRVRRLTQAGVIQRQVAILAPDAFGPSLTTILEVTLERQDDPALAAFEARARDDDSVLQCYRVSPGPDFVLIAQVADMPAYQALSQRLFGAGSGVRNVRGFFSVHRAKFETRIAR